MGGWRWSKKTTVEDCRSVSVADLRRLGVIQRGPVYGYWPIRWTSSSGREVASIGLRSEGEQGGSRAWLRLDYSIGGGAGKVAPAGVDGDGGRGGRRGHTHAAPRGDEGTQGVANSRRRTEGKTPAEKRK